MNETGRREAKASPRTVRVGDHDVNVLRAGSGPALVYLHGLCDVHAVWSQDPLTPFLARLADGREVLAPALPGYDGTTGLESIDDVEDVVWFLSDLLTALFGAGDGRAAPDSAAPDRAAPDRAAPDRAVPVDVVGHSLGGWYAAELALRRPDLVRRLVLLSPLGVHVPGVTVPPFFGAMAPRGIGGMGEARRMLFAAAEGREALGALPDAMTDAQQLQWFGGLAGAARLGWKAPHFQSRKLTARLHRLEVRTLVVRGAQDLLVTEEAARAWTGAVRGARMVEVSDAAHCLVLERPEIADDVQGFLDED